MDPKKTNQSVRFTTEIPAATLAMIDEIRIKMSASSRSEVIRRAIHAFSFMLKAQADGKELIFETASGNQSFFAIL